VVICHFRQFADLIIDTDTLLLIYFLMFPKRYYKFGFVVAPSHLDSTDLCSEFANLFCCRGDTVEVNTWVSANGKNGMRRDWHICDSITGETILKATRFESPPL
jgi:hypothetical protein